MGKADSSSVVIASECLDGGIIFGKLVCSANLILKKLMITLIENFCVHAKEICGNIITLHSHFLCIFFYALICHLSAFTNTFSGLLENSDFTIF